MINTIFHGLVEDQIQNIPDQSVDAVITSPPYANQRANLYGGIPENEYPQWTVGWMSHIRRILKPNGSVAINIRPHLWKGQISDYMLLTRLAIRASGWLESDELIWIKPDSPPLGSKIRPRRAWESIHWFSLSERPFCDPKANGSPSSRLGLMSGKGLGAYIDGVGEPTTGVSRCRDYVEVGTSMNDRSTFNTHPAQYPVALAEWLIRLLVPEGGTVFDPFMGSGTTAIAAMNTGRNFYGTEKEQEYIDIATKRINTGKIDSELFTYN